LSENSGSRSHVVRNLMVAAELQVGIAKIQAKYEIGLHAAVLKAMNRGLYDEGELSKENYEIFDQRYAEKLVDKAKRGREDSHTPVKVLEQQKREQRAVSFNQVLPADKAERLNASFKAIYEEWDNRTSETDLLWRTKNLSYAKRNPAVEWANKLVEKAEKCDILSQGSG
jgi:hypothetical protein